MINNSPIDWQCRQFSALDTLTLYRLLRLRTDVFVVEQQCAYPELDGKDTHQETQHLLAYRDNNLIAYARLLPPGLSYDNASIGRVAVAQSARGGGIGHHLMKQAILYCQESWPKMDIDIAAQAYLQSFYERHGFTALSSPYLEDGIPHIDMRRRTA